MNFEDAKKEAKVSKIPKSVNIKKVSEPNIDTLTYSKAVTTNNKLSTVLKVKQALEFGKYFTFVNAALKPSDAKKINNTKFDNLIFTNKKILTKWSNGKRCYSRNKERNSTRWKLKSIII